MKKCKTTAKMGLKEEIIKIVDFIKYFMHGNFM